MPSPIPVNIGKPALRALEGAGVQTLQQLAKWTEEELGALHGMGPKALGLLRGALESEGLSFKEAQGNEVERFLSALEHPLKKEILALRAIILGADKGITERIKWNAPSFCANGDDRITFKLHPPRDVQLIFHRGAKVKATKGFTFDDPSGLMKFVAPDRAVVTFADMAAVKANKPALTKLTVRWIKATA